MAFELPPLPYDYEALAPYISADTLRFHHDKHHKAYVDKLNELIAGTDFERASLEQIIRQAARQPQHQQIFNNASQVWNHTVQWNCMKPGGGGRPPRDIASRIAQAFGDFDGFKKKFKEAAVGRFGSGYAWLVMDADGLEVISTQNADPPFVDGKDVLLACDVWEHAYYLDYQNRRGDYVDAFLDHVVNWDYVQERLREPTAALREFA
ncbi:MAG TPA: superoxide dismutase [Alphaproteobacteria bacterium]